MLYGVELLPFLNSTMSKSEYYQGIVYSCIDLIAGRASSIDYALVKRQTGDETYVVDENDDKIDQDDILTLLKKPNKLHTASTFFYLLYAYYAAKGEAFIWPVKSMNGSRVAELLLLNPDHIQVEEGMTNYDPIKSYRYSHLGMYREFAPDELIHIYKPNPYNPLRGVSPITMARYDIEAELNAKKWNSKFFKNGGSPSGIFKINTQNKEVFGKVEKDIREKYTGTDNAFKMFVLNKDSDFTAITPTQRDMEYIEQMNLSEKRIHKIFKVPSIFLGSTDEAKYANVWAAKRIFNEVVTEPMLRTTYETLNYWLIETTGDKKKRLKFVNPVPEDFEYLLKKQEQDRLERDQTFKYMTINEQRELDELEPLTNGDMLYEEYLAKVRPQPVVDQPKILKKKALSKIEQLAAVRDEFLDDLGTRYHKSLASHYKKLLEMIDSKAIEKVAKNDPLVSTIAREIWPDTKEWQGLFVDLSFKFGDEAMVEGAIQAVQIFNLPTTFTLKNTTAVAWLTNRVKTTADDAEQTLYNRAREIIARNLDEQVTDIAKMKKEVKKVLAEEMDWRVDRIVRTELMEAYSEASQIKYKESDVKKLIWFTAEDERVCPICEPNHNAVVLRGATFPSGTTKEPAHIQCRCTTAPTD